MSFFSFRLDFFSLGLNDDKRLKRELSSEKLPKRFKEA
jgi:hypothetical protein